MQALDAGLAFAITMLILAVVVTTLVETLHRVFGLREKGLALLLGNFYDRVLASRTVPDDRRAEQRRWFLDMMTVNRGPVGGAPMTRLRRRLHADEKSEDVKFLNWIWSGRRLGELGVTGFMERLGGSEYGAALVNQASAAGEKGIEWMLKDVAQKFEAFGKEASQYFEARARLLSVLVGFGVAFAINVDAIVLFETYMKRPDIAQAVIARGEHATAAYEKLQKQSEALKSTATAHASAASGDAALQKQIDEAQKALQRAADEADAAVKGLKSVGVPIGWSADRKADFRRDTAWSIAGMLLGGLLIGLGAPFWYKAVQGLSAIRGVLKGRQDERAAAAAQGAAASPTQLPTTAIEAFHAAHGASLAAGEAVPPEEAVG